MPVGEARTAARARGWARLAAGLFLFLAFWLFLAVATYGGVGLDTQALLGPWLIGTPFIAAWLLILRGAALAFPIAALLGLLSAAFQVWGASTATYPAVHLLMAVVSVAAGLAAVRGWQVISADRIGDA